MNIFFGRKLQPQLVFAFILLCFGINATGGDPARFDCSMAPEQASVRLFEYLEDPNFKLSSDQEYSAIFSKKLLSSSSAMSVNAAIRAARSTYQDNRTETPLSQRLAAPPALVSRQDSSFNPRGEATIRILSLSTRGKIEQRMSITCEAGQWKIESLSYGPQNSPSGFVK